MLYLLNMLDDDCKFKNDKELIKYCEEATQAMYENDIKVNPNTSLEKCRKVPMFDDDQYIYDTKTGKLYKAERYFKNISKKQK